MNYCLIPFVLRVTVNNGLLKIINALKVIITNAYIAKLNNNNRGNGVNGLHA